MVQVWKIDNKNIYTGESYFIEKPSINEIITPILIGYVKPKWNGTEWIEGATEQEIQEWENSQEVGGIIPTQNERIDMLENMILIIMEG